MLPQGELGRRNTRRKIMVVENGNWFQLGLEKNNNKGEANQKGCLKCYEKTLLHEFT